MKGLVNPLAGAASECLPWLKPLRRKLTLGGQDVHLWRASLDVSDSCIEGYRAILTSTEVSQAERFYSVIQRHRYIVARGLLRKILSRYLQLEAESLSFRYNEYGKPFLDIPGGAQAVSFNLSHSAGLVVLAFALQERRIGVDLEKIRTVAYADLIAQRFFPPEDGAAFEAMPEPLKSQQFFRSWTKLEAYGKALGTGLTAALRGCKISSSDETLRQDLEHVEKDVWSIRCLQPAPQYIAALAVEGRNWQLTCWEWQE